MGKAGDAGVTGVIGEAGGGFGQRAALLHAGGHLGDRVSSDTRAVSCRGVYVVLYHRGQHGHVVALRTNHWILGDGGAARFGGPGAVQPLF